MEISYFFVSFYFLFLFLNKKIIFPGPGGCFIHFCLILGVCQCVLASTSVEYRLSKSLLV